LIKSVREIGERESEREREENLLYGAIKDSNSIISGTSTGFSSIAYDP